MNKSLPCFQPPFWQQQKHLSSLCFFPHTTQKPFLARTCSKAACPEVKLSAATVLLASSWTGGKNFQASTRRRQLRGRVKTPARPRFDPLQKLRAPLRPVGIVIEEKAQYEVGINRPRLRPQPPSLPPP